MSVNGKKGAAKGRNGAGARSVSYSTSPLLATPTPPCGRGPV